LTKLAHIVSVIFHPVFVPIYLILFLMEAEPVMSLYFAGPAKWRFVLSLVLNIVIGPILTMWFLKRQGLIDSMSMPSLKGRSLVYLSVAVWYVFTFILMKRVQLPRVTETMFLGMLIVLLALAAFSLFKKVSAHVAAMGGALAALTWMFWFYGIFHFGWLTVFLLLVGLIASMRLHLQAHTQSEVGLGFLLGFISVWMPLYLIV